MLVLQLILFISWSREIPVKSLLAQSAAWNSSILLVRTSSMFLSLASYVTDFSFAQSAKDSILPDVRSSRHRMLVRGGGSCLKREGLLAGKAAFLSVLVGT